MYGIYMVKYNIFIFQKHQEFKKCIDSKMQKNQINIIKKMNMTTL